MTDAKPKIVRKSPHASEPQVAIVITADHVYLPLDDSGNVGTPWAASDVSTSRVSKRTRLAVPADLARFLSERNQAEVLSTAAKEPPPAAPRRIGG